LKQKPWSDNRTAWSGLPSPAAIESPMPAMSASRTTISLTSRSAVPSVKMTSTLAMVGRLLTRRAFTSSSQGPVTCRGWPSPSSKLQAQPSLAGRVPASVTPTRWSRGAR
jgi:hypothetical protein